MTKSFTQLEVRSMISRFGEISIRQVFSPGDLLLHKTSLASAVASTARYETLPPFLGSAFREEIGPVSSDLRPQIIVFDHFVILSAAELFARE